MLAIITLSLAASIVAYRLSANAAAQIGRYLRETLYHHILSLPYESFNTISASTLITRLSNDVLQIQNMFLMVQRRRDRAADLVCHGAGAFDPA